MEEIFIKKYWIEEDIVFYIHFQNGKAIEQVEISSLGKVFLTSENPQYGESMLYDQPLENLEVEISDFITKETFDKIWYH